jgi:hypothetical protein
LLLVHHLNPAQHPVIIAKLAKALILGFAAPSEKLLAKDEDSTPFGRMRRTRIKLGLKPSRQSWRVVFGLQEKELLLQQA